MSRSPPSAPKGGLARGRPRHRALGRGGGGGKPTGAAFTTFSLASTPPQPAATLCPGNAGCSNFAAEPAIRAAADGVFYASSENGLGSGTVAWKSTDGGRHYASLLS